MINASEKYNVFRLKRRPDLFCAVPEVCVLPRFLRETRWEYRGSLNPDTDISRGFEKKAAEMSGRMNGFYLYQQY